jgi:hypothetical protein
VGANVSVRTVYTVPTGATGLYLVNVYMVNTAAAGGADAAPNVYIHWTDDYGLQTGYIATPANTNTAPTNTSTLVEAVSGSTITFETTAGVYSTSLRYSIYVSVTKL